MINILMASFVTVVIGFLIGFFNLSKWKDSDGDLNVRHVIPRLIAAFVIFLLVLGFNPIGVQRIDAGNIGLKVDRVGNNKGIPVAIQVKGWVWYNAWFTDVIEYSIRQFPIDYGTFNVAAKGGTLIPVKPHYNIYLKPERAVDVYIHLLRGADLASLKDTWLATATTIAMRNVTNRFSPDSIFNYASTYQIAVEEELNKQLNKYFTVDQVNPGQSPPASMQGILQAKAEAVQAAQQAELDRQTADAQKYTKIAQAQGDSAKAVIQAAGEAEAIKLKTRELSEQYVNYIKWLNAGTDVPRVPQTILGSNAGVLLNK